MSQRRRLLETALRQDLTSFTERCFQTVSPGLVYQGNWHVEVMAWYLQQIVDGKIKRLIITLPPRHLKSTCTSVALPAFMLGHDPSARVICASYGNELSLKHARDCRMVMESGWYKALFRRTRLDRAKLALDEFTTTRGGFRLASSVGGALTGRGGNIAIVDDPLKAADAMSEAERKRCIEWFTGTLFSRLDNKETDAIVVTMQRLHADDLVGWLLAHDEGWVHLNLPAVATQDQHFGLGHGRIVGRQEGEPLHPARESSATLQAVRHTLGSHRFEAQYQQNPLPLDGGLIKWPWFQFYDNPPGKIHGDLIVQSWDTASKADEVHDYSVCTTWLRRGSDHYLLNVRRIRLEYPGLKKLIVEQARQHGADVVLIEDKGSGTHLIQDLADEGQLRPIAMLPEGDKTTRMYAQTAKLEAGYVFLPRAAPWLEEFQREILQFPNGRHDDQIDSLSQYLGWETPTPPGEGRYIFAESSIANDPGAPWYAGRY